MWNWLRHTSRRQNKKFFDPTIFQKCWRGVGEQPTFAEQIKLHNEMKQKSKNESEESQLPSNQKGCNERQGFRGNCDSQGKLGMCPSLAEPDSGGFPKNDFHNVSRETLLLGKTVFSIRQKGGPPLLLPASVLQLPRCLVRICNLSHKKQSNCELDSSKKCNCSRKNRLQIEFASQMWATRPHLGSIFEKLLHRKTFPFACGLFLAININFYFCFT